MAFKAALRVQSIQAQVRIVRIHVIEKMPLRRAWTIRSFSITIALPGLWIEGKKWRGPEISAGAENVFEFIKAARICSDWTSVEQLRLNNVDSGSEHRVLRRHRGECANQCNKKYY
ncbi:MAG TPA: hypothetical protein VIK39_14590 [Candidatus Angelobacter sp.]